MAYVVGMASVGESKPVTKVENIHLGHRVAVLNLTESRRSRSDRLVAWEIPGLPVRVPPCRWQGLLDTGFVRIGPPSLVVVVVAVLTAERVHCPWAGIAFA